MLQTNNHIDKKCAICDRQSKLVKQITIKYNKSGTNDLDFILCQQCCIQSDIEFQETEEQKRITLNEKNLRKTKKERLQTSRLFKKRIKLIEQDIASDKNKLKIKTLEILNEMIKAKRFPALKSKLRTENN